jgi:hypothetical protein
MKQSKERRSRECNKANISSSKAIEKERKIYE